MEKEEKYSFIIEFDEITDKQINNLTDYFNNNEIKFQVLKSDYELKKQKEVIDKAIETLEKGITFCENDSQGIYDKCNIAINREKKVLDILKEVSE